MNIAVIHTGHEEQAAALAGWLGGEAVAYHEQAFEDAFRERDGIVAVMALGIVIRKLAPILRDKWTDPPVVAVTPDLRFCVPLLGGHHGANELARRLSNEGMIPVISTATDALGKDSVEEIAARNRMEVINKSSTVTVNKAFLQGDVPVYRIDGPAVVLVSPGVSVLATRGEFIVGIGCNRGTAAEEIVQAIRDALREAGIDPREVLAFSSTVKKSDEAGLLKAIQDLDGALFLVDDETINSQKGTSPSRASLIGLIGVAEPSALSLSKRKEIVMRRRTYGNVTVAIAR